MDGSAVLCITWRLKGRRGRRAACHASLTDVLSTHISAELAPARILEFCSLQDSARVYARVSDAAGAARAAAALDGAPVAALRGLRVNVRVVATPLALAGRAAVSLADVCSSDVAALAAQASNGSGGGGGGGGSTASGVLPSLAGLIVIENFVSEEEEGRLLANISRVASWTSQLSRRVAHFGTEFDYVERAPASATTAAPASPSSRESGVSAGNGGADGDSRGSNSTSNNPMAQPMPTVGPLADAIARIFATGAVGDAGDARLGSIAPAVPYRGIAELDGARGGGWSVPLAAVHGGGVVQRQCTVNEYAPGQGISAHVDSHWFEDGIASLSLADSYVMKFSERSNGGGAGGVGGASFSVYLPARSLLLLRGPARLAYTHGITPRSTDCVDGVVRARGTRVSVTVRVARLRAAPCACAWPEHCEGQGGGLRAKTLHSPRLLAEVEKRGGSGNVGMCGLSVSAAGSSGGSDSGDEESVARCVSAGAGSASVYSTSSHILRSPAIEVSHVHALYDAIAAHFSSTRHSPWPRVGAFVRALPPTALLFDVGCGNGKYLAAREGGGGGGAVRAVSIGVDRAAPLADICGDRGLTAMVGDALCTPLRSNIADVSLSIAVLHHLSSLERRVGAVAELLRVTRGGGGLILIYAWARSQGEESRRAFAAQDVLVPWCLKRHFVRGAGDGPAAANTGVGAAGTAVDARVDARDDASSGGGPMRGGGEGDSTVQRNGGDGSAVQCDKDVLSAMPPGAVLDQERGVVILQRFCHVFESGELEELVAAAARAMGGVLVTPTPPPVRPTGMLQEEEDLTECAIAAARTAADNTPAVPLAPALPPTSFSVHILQSWWEASNWCVLARKV